ncbi:MAG: hypothetical protein AB7E85_00695 [Pseudobdellovibrionaceae bacterium]
MTGLTDVDFSISNIFGSIGNFFYYRFDFTFWDQQPDTLAYMNLSANYEANPEEVGAEVERTVQELRDNGQAIPSYIQRVYTEIQDNKAAALDADTQLITAQMNNDVAQGSAEQAQTNQYLRDLDAATRNPEVSFVRTASFLP